MQELAREEREEARLNRELERLFGGLPARKRVTDYREYHRAWMKGYNARPEVKARNKLREAEKYRRREITPEEKERKRAYSLKWYNLHKDDPVFRERERLRSREYYWRKKKEVRDSE
jgi:hypothetical protein